MRLRIVFELETVFTPDGERAVVRSLSKFVLVREPGAGMPWSRRSRKLDELLVALRSGAPNQ